MSLEQIETLISKIWSSMPEISDQNHDWVGDILSKEPEECDLFTFYATPSIGLLLHLSKGVLVHYFLHTEILHLIGKSKTIQSNYSSYRDIDSLCPQPSAPTAGQPFQSSWRSRDRIRHSRRTCTVRRCQSEDSGTLRSATGSRENIGTWKSENKW